MNILILTPDGVGSTILQRLLTMTLYLEKIKVVNTHELTNGLCLKKGILAKEFDPKYSQKLEEIIELIKKSDKNTQIVSRLAKYHLDARRDSIQSQEKFFNFLNSFYEKKIMCIRNNIFEYALSWSIRERSGVLNVYDRKDKRSVMEVSEVDEDYFLKKCNEYVDYVYWIQDNFPNIEQVSYEDMITKSDFTIEKIIGYKDTYNKNFGVNLSLILKMEYDFFNLLITENNKKFSYTKEEKKALVLYKRLSGTLVDKKIIIGHPIKNTTLGDKKEQIKNFDRCLDKFYSFAKNHNWIDQSIANYDFWNGRNIC
jgi:hypothetical protein